MENPSTGTRFIKRKSKVLPAKEAAKVEKVSGTEDKSNQIKKTEVIPGSKVFQKYFEMGDKGKNKMDDFADVYSLSEIQSDKKRIAEVKNKQERPTPFGVVLENAFYDLSEKLLSDGNGENKIYSQMLSTFDDIIKRDGTRADVALEVKTPKGEVVRLLVDVTTAITMSKLYEKRKKCIENIEKGKLHSVKYFQSKIETVDENGNNIKKKGKQENLPMVIVGMDKESLHEFCPRIGENNDLANDCAAFMFLDEIVKQLRDDYVLSEEINGKNSEITETLLKTYQTFGAILETKNNLRPHDFEEKVVKDGVYTYLIS